MYRLLIAPSLDELFCRGYLRPLSTHREVVKGTQVNKLKIGILGCGKMGKVYARWFSANPSCQVVSFYNRTKSRALDLAANYPNAVAKDTWQEIIEDPNIDVVGICTPSHEHIAQFKSAASAGKHILCEKPMARDFVECREMVEAASATNAKVAVGFQMRFHPVIRKVDELLPKIGQLLHIDFVFGMYRPEINWRHELVQGGGVLKELGSHLFDLGRHWAGEVVAVTAHNRILSSPRQVEDYSLNLMEFESGVTGYLWNNYHDRRGRSICGHLMGTEGQIEWEFSSYETEDSRVVLFTNTERTEIPIEIPSEIDDVYPGHVDSFRREIDTFIDCILNDKKPIAGPIEGMKAMEITNASYESTRLKRRIELPLKDYEPANLEKSFSRLKEE